jgi:hypothetical protein
MLSFNYLRMAKAYYLLFHFKQSLMNYFRNSHFGLVNFTGQK